MKYYHYKERPLFRAQFEQKCFLFALMFACLVSVRVDASPVQAESFQSLATPSAGVVEVAQGTFFSTLLNKEVPCRVFSPGNPEWQREQCKFQKRDKVSPLGMPAAIYTMNLICERIEGKLTLDFTPYQIRLFALTLNPFETQLAPASCWPVALPHNSDVFSRNGERVAPDSGFSARKFIFGTLASILIIT